MTDQLVWDNPQKISKNTATDVLEKCGLTGSDVYENVKLLDFGCGEGRYMRLFAEVIQKESIVGVEVIADRVQKLKADGFNALLLPLEGNTLPFDDEAFDIVFSSNVIEHIPHVQYLGYLAEISRVLKPGGRFMVGTPNYPSKRMYDMVKAIRTEYTRYYLFDDPTHCNKLSINQLEKDLSIHFLTVNLDVSFGFLETFIPWLQSHKNRQKIRKLSDKISGYCVK
jgi:SAM-dependent methyltransferase